MLYLCIESSELFEGKNFKTMKKFQLWGWNPKDADYSKHMGVFDSEFEAESEGGLKILHGIVDAFVIEEVVED